LKVRVEPAFGDVVGMADITADHGFLSANFTNLGHNHLSVLLRNLKIRSKVAEAGFFASLVTARSWKIHSGCSSNRICLFSAKSLGCKGIYLRDKQQLPRRCKL